MSKGYKLLNLLAICAGMILGWDTPQLSNISIFIAMFIGGLTADLGFNIITWNFVTLKENPNVNEVVKAFFGTLTFLTGCGALCGIPFGHNVFWLGLALWNLAPSVAKYEQKK